MCYNKNIYPCSGALTRIKRPPSLRKAVFLYGHLAVAQGYYTFQSRTLARCFDIWETPKPTNTTAHSGSASPARFAGIALSPATRAIYPMLKANVFSLFLSSSDILIKLFNNYLGFAS